MIKLLYKPMTMLVSVLGGIVAGAIFKKAWQVVAREDEAPKATDARRGWAEVLLAAAVQGAIFAVVKAAVDRGAAEGARKVTGVWPGDEGGNPARRREMTGREDKHGAPAGGSSAPVEAIRRRPRALVARTRRWSSAGVAGATPSSAASRSSRPTAAR